MAVVVFALSPTASIQGVIDYLTSKGRKIRGSATHKLSEDQFDCVSEDLTQFLDDLEDRASQFGWSNYDGILDIPIDPADPIADTENLIRNYGTVSLERVRSIEEIYIDRAVRPAQDTNMLYHCIIYSLSKTGKQKLNVWKKQFIIGKYPSGNLLLKVLVRESHLDTNVTTSWIRTHLSSLDEYMMTIGSNIGKFNFHVQTLLGSLMARGETSTDLLTNFFQRIRQMLRQNFCGLHGP